MSKQSHAARCPGCGRPVAECAAEDVDDGWVMTREYVDPQDPIIAGPRWRSALNWIVGFCESHEQHHTGFTHIRRHAQAALGQDLGGSDGKP